MAFGIKGRGSFTDPREEAIQETWGVIKGKSLHNASVYNFITCGELRGYTREEIAVKLCLHLIEETTRNNEQIIELLTRNTNTVIIKGDRNEDLFRPDDDD